jgi:hypothetical protein
MDDVSRFIDLVKCGNTCISIVTYEEYEALEVLRRAAESLEYGMQVWSVGRGIRNGFFPVLPTPAEMEPKTPEHGLKMFLQAPPKTICVALDLAPFLSEQVTLRTLRDTINTLPANLNILVLVHGEDILPGVIKTYTREFELSLPGEKELDNLIRTTLR